MKDLRKEIRALMSGAENAEVEFKSAKGGLPESFWETFSAFANTNGGVIVLGVKEKNGQFFLDGLTQEQINSYKKRFWDIAHNKEKVSATMLTERDVVEGEADGALYLMFRIPRAAYNLRPVYLNHNPFENTFKRRHEGDYHCTEAEVRAMIVDSQSALKPFDHQILPNFSLDDIDKETLRGYRQRFKMDKEDHPWNDLDDISFLQKIGAYRVNREMGIEGFTRAGILMFGKEDSITDETCAPFFFVDFQEALSDGGNRRWINRICPDGTWASNLFQFYFRAYNALAITIPRPFRMEGTRRVDDGPAHYAIREALVNTLVHASYAEPGSILIRRESDRIVMRNPGRMLISTDDFYAGSVSLCRNPTIQKMFVLLGYGEKAGSGASYIVKGWEENHWPRPTIEEKVQPDAVTLTMITQTEAQQEAESHDQMVYESLAPYGREAGQSRQRGDEQRFYSSSTL